MRVNPYLEGSSQPVDSVVRFFGWQPLQGEQDGVVLFGYQIISPVNCINGSFLHMLGYCVSINSSSQPSCSYFRPSFLYPAASLYHFASGIIQFFSQGRFTMNLATDGEDMIVQ